MAPPPARLSRALHPTHICAQWSALKHKQTGGYPPYHARRQRQGSEFNGNYRMPAPISSSGPAGRCSAAKRIARVFASSASPKATSPPPLPTRQICRWADPSGGRYLVRELGLDAPESGDPVVIDDGGAVHVQGHRVKRQSAQGLTDGGLRFGFHIE